MSAISFKAKLFEINSWVILSLPKEASAKLPSRGMTLVKGTINNFPFKAVLEPDGKGSHWFRVDDDLLKGAQLDTGDVVDLKIETTKEWPEPTVPDDLMKALSTTQKEKAFWTNITPMARWDWIRWIRSTKNPETRKHRIEVALSKLRAGTKRPCCFNRAMCTEPYVSNNGVLIGAS